MKYEPQKKKTPTPTDTSRITRMCCSGFSGFPHSGTTTSCVIVSEAL